jgi:hypothetical protein
MGQLALQYSKDRYTYSSESGSNLLGSEQGKISFDWFDLIWFDLIWLIHSLTSLRLILRTGQKSIVYYCKTSRGGFENISRIRGCFKRDSARAQKKNSCVLYSIVRWYFYLDKK